MTFSDSNTVATKGDRNDQVEDDKGYQERNLCVAYGDHDDCPHREIDVHGVLTFCNCSCHLDPETIP